MEKLLARLRRIRFVYRPSGSLTKTVVLSAVALSIVAMVTLGIAIQATRDHNQALADQAAKLEQENGKLEENIENLGSADSVDQIAKDELGLVDPDTTVIQTEP